MRGNVREGGKSDGRRGEVRKKWEYCDTLVWKGESRELETGQKYLVVEWENEAGQVARTSSCQKRG